jgi:hypothetical protein
VSAVTSGAADAVSSGAEQWRLRVGPCDRCKAVSIMLRQLLIHNCAVHSSYPLNSER